MQTLDEFSNTGVEVVFTDIDDTLTREGRLEPLAFKALWDLHDNGIKVVPVTGRPAGWCELIARQWPVTGVVGENGGLYFCYKNKKMVRHFAVDKAQREKNRVKLNQIQSDVLAEIPDAAVASDQFCRLMDLAIDFCEDVSPALAPSEVDKIVKIFRSQGATAKVSSIHVNGWFGDYDKLTMCREFCLRELDLDLEKNQKKCLFVGDSPNDEPMFGFFDNSFAVANIERFLGQIDHKPKYVSSLEGGQGFAEIANKLL